MIANWLIMAAFVAAGPDQVEPGDLTRRPEIVGKTVVVDDRVRYFLESKRGQGYDELMLKRTEVLFRLPARLKSTRPPSEPNARVTGILKVEERRWVFDVLAIEMLPNDLDRVDRELAKLRPDDYQGKRTWALWAQRRGQELKEPKLEERGAVLEGEALWTESSRPDADNLGLAAQSLGRPIPDAVRNALFHRGFRDRLARAVTPAEYDALSQQIESSLPKSVDNKVSAGADSTWLNAYAKDPAVAYRDAPEAARAALDRRLLADAIQRSLERQVEAKPVEAGRLAEIARTRLPDRPELAEGLRRRALIEAEARVSSMRQTEVEDLAKTFRDLGENDRAIRLIQAWLADRRKNRLSATDAEGRILLAGNYEKLLDDRATAAELLREALAIDPQSRTAVDVFLRMGFRKGDSGWYDPASVKANPTASTAEKATTDGGDSLKGLTRAQVRSRLGGKPDQVVRSASQGRCVEQWIYKNGKGTQIVSFVFDPTTTEPRAAAYYSDQK